MSKKILSRADILGLNDKLPKYKKITCEIHLKVRDLLLKEQIKKQKNPYLWFNIDEEKYVKSIKETGLILPEDINSIEELDVWLIRVKKSCFFVYDNTDNRIDNAKRHIYNILKEAGYETNIEEYEVDYHRAIGKDCIEVYVDGEFKVNSFQGSTPENDKL